MCCNLAWEKIGSNVQIDGYTTITANGPNVVKIGSYVHIGGSCFLLGEAGIEMAYFLAFLQVCGFIANQMAIPGTL